MEWRWPPTKPNHEAESCAALCRRVNDHQLPRSLYRIEWAAAVVGSRQLQLGSRGEHTTSLKMSRHRLQKLVGSTPPIYSHHF
jgi:hypothetical protein